MRLQWYQFFQLRLTVKIKKMKYKVKSLKYKSSNISLVCNKANLFSLLEVVYVTIGNPAFCLVLYLTGVHFRAEL